MFDTFSLTFISFPWPGLGLAYETLRGIRGGLERGMNTPQSTAFTVPGRASSRAAEIFSVCLLTTGQLMADITSTANGRPTSRCCFSMFLSPVRNTWKPSCSISVSRLPFLMPPPIHADHGVDVMPGEESRQLRRYVLIEQKPSMVGSKLVGVAIAENGFDGVEACLGVAIQSFGDRRIRR